MAIATPAVATVTKEPSLLLPAMDSAQLHVALNNGNYLYLHHIPPLVSFTPLGLAGGRENAFVVPIVPSADALPYDFYYRILPAFNGTTTIRVEEATSMAGPFNTIYGPTATGAMVNGTWYLRQHTTTIPAGSRVLRFTFSAWGGTGKIGHILAHPAAAAAAVPFVAPYGETASGFRVYEDSLLYAAAAAGQPVNTEFLDRCRRNAVKVLRDRYQCAFSMVQEDGVGAHTVLYPAPATAGGAPMAIGHARFVVPGLRGGGSGTLTVLAIGTVSAGATANLIIVKVGTQTLKLAASGAVVSGTMTITGATNEVRVFANVDGANTTYLHACIGLWLPGD